ncbi:glycoside hydrolase family 3 protein [Microbacterium sp. LRZ72]|uniref:glycoside hydrolase family 3 N-terminal domain-containing protein n=1 Tax=Microbacterium sp. LRZ72 TaxID=2942481 RepID=UPI0029B4E9F2|nr:glycoside hydrolase family 3 N-terminal domain-containing protein [Microbacterium sp. LRZ72]MDX2375479.1 glycoside hydrolase family 3 protein [Microbacterium sp. LRZ72]
MPRRRRMPRARRAAVLGAAICALVLPAAASDAARAVAHADVADTHDGGAVRVVAGEDADRVAHARRLVAAMTVPERAASVVMAHTPTASPQTARAFMAETGVGGFIVMGANVGGSAQELRSFAEALTVDAALPPLVAVDQEGGDVSRLPWDEFPSARTLKSAPPGAADEAFTGRGALVEGSGIGINFGVVADYTDDPGSFIYHRALGTDPAGSAERVSAAVAGEARFAASTLKHFPGHGAAPGDSHVRIPSSDMTLAQWRASEALPFAAGIDAGAPLVMFGHLAYTAVDDAPASLSAAWHDILRGELGFTGVAITDDMAMLEASGLPRYQDPVANAVRALAAGNDVVLGVAYSTPQQARTVVTGIADAVEADELDAARLHEAAARAADLRLALGGAGGAALCAGCEPVG